MTARQGAGGSGRTWTFLTNHAHVLLVVRKDPGARLTDIGVAVGITARGVQLILDDLEEAGYVRRVKVGRRNEHVVLGGPLRHPLDRGHSIDELLSALDKEPESGPPPDPRPDSACQGVLGPRGSKASDPADVAAP